MDDLIWIAAEYHFPFTYSIRVPGSSMANTKAMPAPGPGTVRLALIRTGIELFGFRKTEMELFPTIRTADIRICPPSKVAISKQVLNIYKPTIDKFGISHYQKGIGVREFAHAQGAVTIFMQIPKRQRLVFESLFSFIGYWGQTNSFSECTRLFYKEPNLEECGLPIEQLRNVAVGKYVGFVSDFQHDRVKWQDIVLMQKREEKSIRTFLFVWPMEICERDRGDLLLLRLSQDK